MDCGKVAESDVSKCGLQPITVVTESCFEVSIVTRLQRAISEYCMGCSNLLQRVLFKCL